MNYDQVNQALQAQQDALQQLQWIHFAILVIIVINVALLLWSLISLIYSKHEPTMKVFWVIVIIFLPIVGPWLYLTLGKKRTPTAF